MLEKKRKRKISSVTLVPEPERIFAGKIFFYIPPDDAAPKRRIRITKARSYGATWTKDWTPDITHIVVDNDLDHKQVTTFTKSTLKVDVIPPSVIMVNEEYPLDCIQFRMLLDPKKGRYVVKAPEASSTEKHPTTPSSSQRTDVSLQIKSGKSGEAGALAQRDTPSRSQVSTQREGQSLGGALLQTKETEPGELLETPQQPTPAKNHAENWRLGDALDELIVTAKGLEFLPLSDDEDDNRSSEELDHSGSFDEERARRKIKNNRISSGKNELFNQNAFSCMKGGTGVALEANPNERTIEVLQEMCDIYERVRDQWRSRAYRRAIGVLKKQNMKITSFDEARSLTFVGDRLAAKIQEIALTDRLRRLDNAKLEPTDQILSLFLKIYGVGLSQAWKWIQAGHRTLDDLKAHARLSESQRLGIDHYDHFNTRIPREEMTALGSVVKAAVLSVDPTLRAIIGGSYRRGASTSGDIDFILTKPGTSSSHELIAALNRLVDLLTQDRFLVAALSTPSRYGSGSTWHGACVLPGSSTWRRIDLLLVPESQLGAALIYFTGDDIFNRSIRLLSNRKGMKLNQRGLYTNVLRGPGGVKLSEGTLVEGADEKKIFAALGVPWRPPEQRICH